MDGSHIAGVRHICRFLLRTRRACTLSGSGIHAIDNQLVVSAITGNLDHHTVALMGDSMAWQNTGSGSVVYR